MFFTHALALRILKLIITILINLQLYVKTQQDVLIIHTDNCAQSVINFMHITAYYLIYLINPSDLTK